MAGVSSGLFDAKIFESLQQKIDEDAAVREVLRDIVQELEKQDRSTQAILSRAHSTTTADLPSVLDQAEASIKNEIATIARLNDEASKFPYYKYNFMWSRQMQDATFSTLFLGYLRGYCKPQGGSLLTIEDVGATMNVPVNLKDRDAFHLTIEEYLHALISLTEELTRLTRNAVTLSNHTAPLQIAKFIKDLFAGFQVLNLKNDSLRKRSDGIKYRVKEVEDVVYDLSLRGLVKQS
ncbi:translin [Elsinoe australis]|uniref:Translin n=1 Tax=Elsinoe australis TaxID=40998 RepID=A0A4U7B577_9PEZI|nr:translin [Elsinoe australis]